MGEFAPVPIGPRGSTPVKKVEAVVSGPTKIAKKSELRRLADLFLYRDGKSIKTYLVGDVLVPSGKKAISDIARNTINTFADVVLSSLSMAIWGEPDRIGKSAANGASKTSYQQYYDRRRDQGGVARSPVSRFEYEDIIFERMVDAEDVLDGMREIIDQYQVVSVGDLYELAKIKSEHTLNNYGWSDISSATIRPAQGGYILRLPRPGPLN